MFREKVKNKLPQPACGRQVGSYIFLNQGPDSREEIIPILGI
jgi:hypothetical protein